MAAASFSLTAAVEDIFQLGAAAQQQAPAATTPVNANQAQGAPAPADTVTLTNRSSEGQLGGQDANPGRSDRAVFFGSAALMIGENRAQQNGQPKSQQVPSLPVLLPQLEPQNAPAAAPANTADPAANQSSTANAGADAANTAGSANAADPAPDSAAVTPQQQLQQLDQTLLQLGVNPDSIPIFNRMAMLLYANDPAAVQMLVHALQTAAAQQGSALTGANPPANTNAAATQSLLQSAAQPPQGQPSQEPAGAPAQNTAVPQPAPQIEVLVAQINFTGAQASLPTQPAQVAASQSMAASGANMPTLSNPLSVQVEELQVAIQAVEIQTPEQPNAAALNVTA
jgi:hypothetical protein